MYKKLIVAASALSLVVAFAVATPALAWHPKGVIVKKVQNVTQNSALSDANTEGAAVKAKPGDTIKYVIEIRNDGQKHERGWNDMHYTVMTDSLPNGVQLTSNAGQREIKENIGVIKAGEKVVKEYTLKVTATSNGYIKNTACFTGDSEVKDQPQKGCDPAIIKVEVPEKPKECKPGVPVGDDRCKETPKECKPGIPVGDGRCTDKPKEEPKQEVPQVLPATGPAEILGSAFGISAVGYAAHSYIRSRRNLK